MTVSLETEAEIRRLYFAEHWKRGTIATQLGIHFDVVKRVLGRLGCPPGRVKRKAELLEPFIPFIDETLAQYPTLLATRLFDMIRERGYTGSQRTLRRYVHKARPRPRKAYLRIETLPGEVAQVDWAHVGEIVVPGGKRPLWVFVLVLAYSRALFAELVIKQDAPSLRRSLLRSSLTFSGSPRAWLFDNAKTVVVERRGRLVRFHPDLIELAAQLHVELRVCDPRAPNQKGTVERAIRYLKDRFFAARTFHSIAHGNAQLESFIRETAHQRPHPRLATTVAEALAEEQHRLLPLPANLPPLEQVIPVPVDTTGFINFDGNRYSVPSAYAERTVTLAADDNTVRLLDGDREVARHERDWGRKQTHEESQHREELLAERRGARDVKGRDRLRAVVPAIEELLARWADHGRNIGSMVAHTLRLLNAYGDTVMRAAVDEMTARGTHDIGALAILCEQQRRKQRVPLPPFIDLGAHVPERDVLPHDLGGYDE